MYEDWDYICFIGGGYNQYSENSYKKIKEYGWTCEIEIRLFIILLLKKQSQSYCVKRRVVDEHKS